MIPDGGTTLDVSTAGAETAPAQRSQPSSRRRLPTGLIGVFALAPLISGTIGRFVHTRHWFADYEAVACASQHALHGEAFYSLHLACPMMRAAVYVYPPIVAQVGAYLLGVFGGSGAAALYGACFWGAVSFLLWAAIRGHGGGSARARAPFLALISGSAVFWGNIAVIAHGAIAAAALVLEAQPWALIVAIAVAATIKPVFLTYLAIPLLAPGRFWRRVFRCGVGVVLGLLPTVLFMVFGGASFFEWQALLHHFVLDTTPGVGFLGWLSFANLNDLGLGMAWAAFAALLVGASLIIAEKGDVSRRGRIWLGLTVATLLNPRLMSEDLFLLGPGLVVAAEALGAAAGPITTRGLNGFYGAVCCLTALLTLAGGRLGQQLAIAAFVIALLVIGGVLSVRAWRPRRGGDTGCHTSPQILTEGSQGRDTGT